MTVTTANNEDPAMTAKPLIPGRAYRVTAQGLDLIVLTTNPMRAIVLALQETRKCSR